MMIERTTAQRIWKFEIPPFDEMHRDEFKIDMPDGAQILAVQVQYGKPYIWALVDPDASALERKFRIAGTGHSLEYKRMRYVGTFQLLEGRFIGHLFEV